MTEPNGSTDDGSIDEIRRSLDRVDDRLVALVNERAILVEQIGKVKAREGIHAYAPDREREVFDRISRLNRGPITNRSLQAIYRELMSSSLSLERLPRIAVLGPPGSFSHLAARRKFGTSVEYEPVASIRAVFDEIEHEHAQFGLAPVENSVAGGVGETLDLLVDRPIVICAELNLAVHHHLLGNCPLEEVEHVYSKPEVFAQCKGWLSSTGLAHRTLPEVSSSAAAERASRQPGAAAIASDLAQELFGLQRIASFIEDDPNNVTRFLVLGTTEPHSTGSDRTSVVFSVGHQPGTLASVLECFRQGGINMTRIESRPDRHQRWTYHFFVDVEGHASDPELQTVLSDTQRHCRFWKVLGSYPRSPGVLT